MGKGGEGRKQDIQKHADQEGRYWDTEKGPMKSLSSSESTVHREKPDAAWEKRSPSCCPCDPLRPGSTATSQSLSSAFAQETSTVYT